MRRLRIFGLWLVFQILSTSQDALNNANSYRNATLDILPTPMVLKSSNKQSLTSVYGLSSVIMGKGYTDTLQASDLYSHTLASGFTSERTQSESTRNLFNRTQSKSVRNLFTWTNDIRTFSSMGSVFNKRLNRTYVDKSTETNEINASTLDERNSRTLMTSDRRNVQDTTAVGYSSLSLKKPSSHAKWSAIQKSHQATNVFESSITKTKSNIAETSRGIPHSKTMVISSAVSVLRSRSYEKIESSSHNRFSRNTQTISSRIINATLSRAGVSKSRQVNLNKTRLSSFTVTNYIATPQISTLRSVEPSKKLDSIILSSYRISQFSRHGNKSSTTTEYLTSSTINKVLNSGIEPTSLVVTAQISTFRNVEPSKTLESIILSSYRTLQFSPQGSKSSTKTKYLTSSTTNKVLKSGIEPTRLVMTAQISTLRNVEPSKTMDCVNVSSYRTSQFSRHGNQSSITTTEYLALSTTTNKVSNSGIEPTRRVIMNSKGVSQTCAIKESTNKVESSDVFSPSSPSFVPEVGSTIFKIQRSKNKFRIRTNNGVMVTTVYITDNKSQQISTEVHKLSTIISTTQEVHKLSTIITTTRYQSSGKAPNMPLYVLAIFLPLALLVGFTIALVYFKRNKEDQRVRYSVTVEIASENPDFELKRMYSIIDISTGINKDILSGLASKKSSNTKLDQLDRVSVSISQPDETV